MRYFQVSFVITVIIFLCCNNPKTFEPEIEPIVLTMVPTHVSIYKGSDGSIDLEVSGGTTPDIYNWSNGDTTEDINNLTAGIYNVTVTDANSQKKEGSAIVSPPGKIVFTIMSGGENNGIYMMNSDGSNLHRIIKSGEDAIFGGSAWSPDSSKIAFYSHPTNASTWSIFVMNSDGSDLLRLTNVQDAHDYSPTWSQDGSRIAFQRDLSSLSEIWVMNADGSNAHQIDSVNGGGPEWSCNGNLIVFYSERHGYPEIYSMNADGTNEQRLTNNIYTDVWPAWSPDDSKIAFTSGRTGYMNIFVMNSDGTQPRRLTSGFMDTRPDWSPDGTRIAFVSDREGNPEIYVMDADGSNETRLTYSNGKAIQPDWCP
jgi:Tol biopolymer transport system component